MFRYVSRHRGWVLQRKAPPKLAEIAKVTYSTVMPAWRRPRHTWATRLQRVAYARMFAPPPSQRIVR
jgi:hypothetical protein